MKKLFAAAIAAASLSAAGCATYPNQYGYDPYGYNNGYYNNGYGQPITATRRPETSSAARPLAQRPARLPALSFRD